MCQCHCSHVTQQCAGTNPLSRALLAAKGLRFVCLAAAVAAAGIARDQLQRQQSRVKRACLLPARAIVIVKRWQLDAAHDEQDSCMLEPASRQNKGLS